VFADCADNPIIAYFPCADCSTDVDAQCSVDIDEIAIYLYSLCENGCSGVPAPYVTVKPYHAILLTVLCLPPDSLPGVMSPQRLLGRLGFDDEIAVMRVS
jgi:hypothetical protein